MTTPSPIPEKTLSGISVDPKTLDRVVPESRRPDGSIRKEIKIRPGYTPREDITRFRSSRQTQMDRIALPPGHIQGWVAPSSSSKTKTSASGSSTSKSAKKNEKRKAKRDNMKEEIIKSHWDDDDETVVKDPDGAPNWAKTAEMRSKGETSAPCDNTANKVHKEPAEDETVVKDPDGAPNWAETAKIRSKGETSASWDETANKMHKEPAGDETVVKDPDGAPNWAKTAEMLSKGETSASWDKTTNEVCEESVDDKVNDNEEPPKDDAEDLGQKLENLELL